jgi:HAD superfamily hydrolase (TIGR01509 family)
MIRGLVLDMDGVIVDSELQWRLAEREFFAALAPSWRDEDHERVVGLSPVDCFHYLRDHFGMTRSREEFMALCDQMARRIYSERVTLTPSIPFGRLPTAIASSSPRPWIDLVLARFGLSVDAVASGDETPGRTKPHPDLYLLACERLGLAPAACLAVEDSNVGVRAAKAAGLLVAAYRNGHNDGQDLSLADAEFSDFAAFDYAAVSSRLSRA